jgi:hypothetical protein
MTVTAGHSAGPAIGFDLVVAVESVSRGVGCQMRA